MSEQNNISSFSNGGKGLPEDMLLAYIEGRLSAEQQHEVERWMADEGMESDAMEGLSKLGAAETRHIVSKLNHGLRKNIARKKKRRQLDTNSVTWVAIGIILLLIVVAYMVIRTAH